MKRQDNLKAKIFKSSNLNLEKFTSIGLFFNALYVLIFIVDHSFYYYIYASLKYVFWFSTLLFVFSWLNFTYTKYIYFRKLSKDNFKIKIPEFVYEGEEIKYRVECNVSKFMKDKLIYVKPSVNLDEEFTDEKMKDAKILYNNNDLKWKNRFGYGDNLNFNLFSLFAVDFTQSKLSDEKKFIFGKQRGKIVIDRIVLYKQDIFSFLRTKKIIKIDPVIVRVIPNNKTTFILNENMLNKSISYDGSEESINIKGIKKAKRGESLKNIHWKLFAKKEELWVVEKEKKNNSPITLLVDLRLNSPENKAEGFEKMISDVFNILNSDMIKNIIIENKSYDIKEHRLEIVDLLLNVKNTGGENIKVDNDLLKEFKKVLYLTVNNENLIEKEIDNKNVKVITYD